MSHIVVGHEPVKASEHWRRCKLGFAVSAVRLLSVRRPPSQRELVHEIQGGGGNLLYAASALLLGTACLIVAAHALLADEWLTGTVRPGCTGSNPGTDTGRFALLLLRRVPAQGDGGGAIHSYRCRMPAAVSTHVPGKMPPGFG